MRPEQSSIVVTSSRRDCVVASSMTGLKMPLLSSSSAAPDSASRNSDFGVNTTSGFLKFRRTWRRKTWK